MCANNYCSHFYLYVFRKLASHKGRKYAVLLTHFMPLVFPMPPENIRKPLVKPLIRGTTWIKTSLDLGTKSLIKNWLELSRVFSNYEPNYKQRDGKVC